MVQFHKRETAEGSGDLVGRTLTKGLANSLIQLVTMLLVVLVLKDSFVVGYYMFPENSEDCGISVFYTHRESRGRGGNEENITFRNSSSSSRTGRYIRSSSRNSKVSKSKNSKSSYSQPRSSRANSRVMKWKSKNPADIEGPLARIVGGTVAQPYAWPWQISLQLKHPTMGFIGHWCGGVLIGAQWVITAGHCVNNRLFGLNQRGVSWFVMAGEYDRSKTEGTEKMIGVSRVFVHERFRDFDNDIALVKLSRPIQWSPTVSPVCLPNDDVQTLSFNMTGLKCVATGWGMESSKGRLSSKMQQVWVHITSQEKCDQIYQRHYHMELGIFTSVQAPKMKKLIRDMCRRFWGCVIIL
ncbi:Ovochymase-1 [Orchesella cincta]|uniref:Ovochymase-1 n=1 Tax=Orchesella cincta TaxID=48709 RepID=A0A1D2MBG7_ORCCI|nr:Ovochymase-1 [Orchesella cincta]